MRKPSSGGLVYSTDGGRMCPQCRQPVSACRCARSAPVPTKGDGVARVRRESKGRGGKTVTIVQGLPLDGEALGELARRLRTACGAGGTVKDGVIEVQGDHADRVLAWLQAQGHSAKRAGG